MAKEKPRYKISPQLVDDINCGVIDDKKTLLNIISKWCDKYYNEGYGAFSVRIVRMSDEMAKVFSDSTL